MSPTDIAEARQDDESVATIVPLFREHIESPDTFRLDRAIARIRKLLNDPEALRARADALLNGTAQPLLALGFVALTGFRMVAGPPAPHYFHVVGQRRSAAAAAAVAATVPHDPRVA